MGLRINVLADDEMRREIVAFVREQIRPAIADGVDGLQTKVNEVIGRIEKLAEQAVRDAMRQLNWDWLITRLIRDDASVRNALAPRIPVPTQEQIQKAVEEQVARQTEYTIQILVDKAVAAKFRKLV